MARDLDFILKKTAPLHSAELVKPLPQSVISHARTQKATKLATWIWVIVVILIVVWIFFFYYLSLRPSSVSQQPTANVATEPPATNPAGTLLGAQESSNLPQVTLYNSGAGSEAVKALASTLTAHGFTTQNLGDSEFQLDQTYIWYQVAYTADAQKIQALLPGRKVAMRQYAGTGPYKILIQLSP